MKANDRIEYLVKTLNLEEHPEGGYYREVYRSDEMIPSKGLPGRYKGERAFSTSIYYLIMGKYPSKFHRITSDEIWHFYEGGPVDAHIITPDGKHEVVTMGNPDGLPVYQYTFEKNSWFGGIVNDPESYCLLGCTVAPGFDFHDFEMAKRETLTGLFPDHENIIRILT